MITVTNQSTSTIVQPAASEATVIKGREAAPKRQSRASRSAAKNTASKPAASKPAADKPTPGTGAASLRAAAKKSEPTATAIRDLVFAALMKAAGDIVSRPPKGVTAEQCRAILSQRLKYCGGETWDSRLGPRHNIASRTPAKK
jgi:hypothetical protein